MTSSVRPLVVLAVTLALGCSENAGPRDAGATDPGDASIPTRLLCDGSDSLRLMVTVVSALGRFRPGQRVLAENGSYILVDGHCNYWVASADDMYEAVRTGTLDGSTQDEFTRDFRYDRWPQYGGVIHSGVPAFDAANIEFLDSEVRIVCEAGCEGDGTPTDVAAIRDAVTTWNSRLWNAGAPVGGSVRISVVEAAQTVDDLPSPWIPVSWPVSVPIATLAVSEADGSAEALGPGNGEFVTGADATALRQMRRDFLSSNARALGIMDIIVQEGNEPMYYVNVRDTTPFEDEQGLIPMLYRWPG